jgi:predicted DNA-binding transcriptional regulator AlpA
LEESNVRESKATPGEEKPVRGELLTITEAAEKIHLSNKWIYVRMENGTLPFPWFMPSPGKRFIDSADLEDFLRTAKIPVGEIRRREYKKKEAGMKQ